jgi:hypothetical protein
MRLKVFLKLATNARIDTNFFAVLFVFIREFVEIVEIEKHVRGK